MWPRNPATRFRPPLATVVSAEPFSHGTGTLQCLQKEMATYIHWSVSLWRDPDDVSHCRILSPDKTEWRLISATLCGWGCCFVADQLWLMTRIREEEEDCWHVSGCHCWHLSGCHCWHVSGCTEIVVSLCVVLVDVLFTACVIVWQLMSSLVLGRLWLWLSN